MSLQFFLLVFETEKSLILLFSEMKIDTNKIIMELMKEMFT
jgi:hypothetical protein